MILRRREFGWFGFSVTFILGVALLAITYGMYRDAVLQDEIASRGQVVCMKIIDRYRGAGTVKYPDEINAEYKGKNL